MLCVHIKRYHDTMTMTREVMSPTYWRPTSMSMFIRNEHLYIYYVIDLRVESDANVHR